MTEIELTQGQRELIDQYGMHAYVGYLTLAFGKKPRVPAKPFLYNLLVAEVDHPDSRSWEYLLSHERNYTYQQFSYLVDRCIPRALRLRQIKWHLTDDPHDRHGPQMIDWGTLIYDVAAVLCTEFGFVDHHGHGRTVGWEDDENLSYLDETQGETIDWAVANAEKRMLEWTDMEGVGA